MQQSPSKAEKAETEYKQLVSKGISEAAIPGMQQQKNSTQDSLAALQKQDTDLQASLASKAGFLYGKSDVNAVTEQLAQLMQKHHLEIQDERQLDEVKVADLPRSYADIKFWLGDQLKAKDSIHILRLKFLGNYVPVYEVLLELAQTEAKALPVFLSMKSPAENETQVLGVKSWVLDLWI